MSDIPTEAQYEEMKTWVGPYGWCRVCGREAWEFRDYLSFREYCITQFCQECQDRVFGKEEEP